MASSKQKIINEQRDEITRLKDQLKAKNDALDKLARLGNEPFLGNSDGNIIAQKALKGE